jgi:chromosome segregation ATPase
MFRAVDEPQEEGIKDRLQRQGEEALGRLAEELAANPLVTGALQRAFEAREKAVAAQNVAMGALNIPSAADIERLTRRLRSVSQRLEAIEDTLDRVEARMQNVAQPEAGTDEQVLARLEEVARDIAALREALAPADQPVPRAQERLSVSE